MNHRVEAVRQPQETQRVNEITEKIIGCAIEVHKHLGPGLLESAYEECTGYEMTEEGCRETAGAAASDFKGVFHAAGRRHVE